MKTFISFISCILILMAHAYAQKPLPLYDGPIPGSKPAPNEETSEMKGGVLIISKVSQPTITPYFPAPGKANGAAVVICPGGGYWIVAAGHEGADVAKAFTQIGVTAFVLKYRIPNDATMTNRETAPLQDAQRALQLVRQRAKEWHIDPARVGILGFSAGGHLASTVGTHFNHKVLPGSENDNLRPDFMVLVYPVVSFVDSSSHRGSSDQLLGKTPTEEKLREYSNELQVTDQTPPTILIHASDDDGVPPQNSILFYQALRAHHVPAELHIYESGGHGFGLKVKNPQEQWMDRVKNWMALNGWLTGKQ